MRPDGTVKVLDFGLAKAMEPAGAMSPSVSQSPTITTPAMMTGVGMILGTAAYMSPEQARGKAVDKRTDIWAFGAVLYEMLTGQRAFEAEDVSMTLSMVLQREPDFDAASGLGPGARQSGAARVSAEGPEAARGDIHDFVLRWRARSRPLCRRRWRRLCRQTSGGHGPRRSALREPRQWSHP